MPSIKFSTILYFTEQVWLLACSVLLRIWLIRFYYWDVHKFLGQNWSITLKDSDVRGHFIGVGGGGGLNREHTDSSVYCRTVIHKSRAGGSPIPNIRSTITASCASRIQMCTGTQAPRSVRFKGHYRNASPQDGTCFVYPLRRLEFWGGA